MGWLIGGGIAALLLILGRRKTTLPSGVDTSDFVFPVNYARSRSGTAGPGRGVTLGSTGVRQCCGSTAIYAESPAAPRGGVPTAPVTLPGRTIQTLRPSPVATPLGATGRYITRLGVRLYQ